jgi:putative salt-induced outer membrane protein YdiY
MHHTLRTLILLGALGAASCALADDAPPPAATPVPDSAIEPAPIPVPPPPPPAIWKANAEVGYISSSTGGNSNQSFHGKLHGEYQSGPWAHEGNVDALSAQSNAPGAKNAEHYTVNTKSKRSFTPLDYLFVQTQWDKDVQSPLDYQAFISAGYGRYLIKSDTQELTAELGAGYRHSEAKKIMVVPPAPPPPQTSDDTIGNFNANYHWAITPAVSFGEKVDVQYGADSTVSHSVTELKQAVSKALAFTLNYDYRRTDLDKGPAMIDRITTFNLIYQFN